MKIFKLEMESENMYFYGAALEQILAKSEREILLVKMHELLEKFIFVSRFGSFFFF